jgi:hypothetical protein
MVVAAPDAATRTQPALTFSTLNRIRVTNTTGPRDLAALLHA